MRYENNDTLREFLDRGAAGDYREHLRHPSFEIDDAALACALQSVREQHPHLPEDQVQARAVFRLLTCGAPPAVVMPLPSRAYRLQVWFHAQAPRAWRWLRIAWAVALLLLAATAVLLLSSLPAHSEPQPEPEPLNVVPQAEALRALLLRPPSLYPQFAGGAVIARMQFLNGSNVFVNVSPSSRLPVTCDNCAGGGGGGGGTSSVDQAAFTEGTTSFTPSGGYYETAPTTLSDGQGGTVLLTSKRAFRITAFDSGGTESFTSGNAGFVRFPSAQAVTLSSTTITGTVAATQSGTWTVQPGNTANTTPWLVTGTGGTFPVTGTFWQATQPVSWTGQSVTVTQGTGSNLHMVCDSGCTPGGSFADSSAFTFGTTAVNNMGAVVDDTSTNTVAENSAGAPRMNANRILYHLNTDSTGAQVGTASAPFRIDPTGTTTQPVSITGGNFPDNEPFNVAQINGSTTQVASNGMNTTGAGLVAAANVAQCDATTPTTITENQFGLMRMNCATHDLAVEAVGTLADNGVASATNRLGTMPGIYRTQGAGATSGRNAAQSMNPAGLTLTAVVPENGLESYSASSVVASAASATDIAVLPGNATNTVLVTELRVSCTQTTAGIIELHVKKNSSADTGGTSTGMTEIPDDSNYSAADSAALVYTANPTVAGTLGDIDVAAIGCMAAGTATPNDIYIGNFRQKPIVLRGTAQQLAVNLNGVTVSGGSFKITYKWIEATGF